MALLSSLIFLAVAMIAVVYAGLGMDPSLGLAVDGVASFPGSCFCRWVDLPVRYRYVASAAFWGAVAACVSLALSARGEA